MITEVRESHLARIALYPLFFQAADRGFEEELGTLDVGVPFGKV
jgi:hypothetical protein